MTLFCEIAAGAEPILYRSKKRLYLAPRKYLLKCYVFACKADAMRKLKTYQFEHGEFVERALRETPVIPQVYRIQKAAMRRRVRAIIESNQPAAPIDSDDISTFYNEGDYYHDDL